MTFIEELARERGLNRLWLTVNKGNPAVTAYQRMGFQIAASIVIDIGGGFVMDDFPHGEIPLMMIPAVFCCINPSRDRATRALMLRAA